jgi:hypothetical protein
MLIFLDQGIRHCDVQPGREHDNILRLRQPDRFQVLGERQDKAAAGRIAMK